VPSISCPHRSVIWATRTAAVWSPSILGAVPSSSTHYTPSHIMLSEPRISKTQKRKAANKDYLQTRRGQAKLQKQIDQDLLRQALAFTFPSIPRIHICDPRYGPKHKPRVSPDKREKGERKRWSELESRILQDIPHNGTYQFVGIPNPNYTPGTHTPCWAALRFPSCVSVESQKELEEYVRKCEEVCINACTSSLSLTCCS
jgi:hypothetical protein